VLRRLDELPERTGGKALPRQGDVVHRHAILAQHCRRHDVRGETRDLRLHARLRHARQQRHEQRLLERPSEGARAHDVQHSKLSIVGVGHDGDVWLIS
jgi:hypothetical protein